MEKCACYHTYKDDNKWGYCFGTKEGDPCNCQGDKLNCDFYDYIRKEAEKELRPNKINAAIQTLIDNGYNVVKKDNGYEVIPDDEL